MAEVREVRWVREKQKPRRVRLHIFPPPPGGGFQRLRRGRLALHALTPLPRHVGARDIGLEATPPAADARPPVEVDRHVPQLTAEPALAAVQPPLQDDAAADTGAERQDYERARTLAGAEHPLAERQDVHVVVHEDRES